MEKEFESKVKKKFSQVAYGTSIIILLLMVLQIAIVAYGLTILREDVVYLYGISVVVGIIAIIYVINESKTPEYRMSWILFILMFPFVGTVFYLFVKLGWERRSLGKKLRRLQMLTSEYMEQDTEIISYMKSSRFANVKLSHYLFEEFALPTYSNTQLKYYPSGETKFEALLNELQKAKKFIFMEYFIVEEGIMWNTILEVLEEKVQEGVEVRFMYDGMCSIAQLPYDYPHRLKAKGIRCKIFNPLRPVLSTVQNSRDHRKICVIDGKVGFTGGVNLADEYINEKRRFGHWKDTAIKLQGDAVQSLTIMFLQMWNVTERQPEHFERYLTKQTQGFNRSTGYVIPYADNPYDGEAVGAEVYLHILNHARDYVHIMTPYLILDYDMMRTLMRVAKSGVEVIIIMPHIPDKKYAFDLAKTYYRELLQAGVKIYEYTPGFMHAKVFVSDDDTATVGTINLDYRSLYLHFECGVFVYHNQVVHQIEKDFQKTLRKCHKVTLTEVQNRSLYSKLCGHLLRLIAPLM
jgi:Phosphatidylserine/phosphatidylglycerophosphate/cardiolipin synthases and related enzymes